MENDGALGFLDLLARSVDCEDPGAGIGVPAGTKLSWDSRRPEEFLLDALLPLRFVVKGARRAL